MPAQTISPSLTSPAIPSPAIPSPAVVGSITSCGHPQSSASPSPFSNTTGATDSARAGHAVYAPPARSVEEFQRRLAVVRARIAAACGRCGRDPADVRLLPVSKTIDEATIRLSYAAGLRELGENKVQEAERKATAMADLSDLRWSVIGHLQTNKAKVVARMASEFQALDSWRLAEALERRLQAEGRALDVFVQVNTSGEASKFGLPPDQVHAFLQRLPACSALRVRGLMTLAMLSADTPRVRECFVLLRNLRDRLRQDLPAGMALDELSMGMSGDFETAIEEGATVVRVGQAIYGARALPDSHYWPSEPGPPESSPS